MRLRDLGTFKEGTTLRTHLIWMVGYSVIGPEVTTHAMPQDLKLRLRDHNIAIWHLDSALVGISLVISRLEADFLPEARGRVRPGRLLPFRACPLRHGARKAGTDT